jgi:hypothetical protein
VKVLLSQRLGEPGGKKAFAAGVDAADGDQCAAIVRN